MSDWQAWVGKEQVQTDTLTPALLDRFRATIDSDAKGDIAPQGIHFALCLPDAATATLGPTPNGSASPQARATAMPIKTGWPRVSRSGVTMAGEADVAPPPFEGCPAPAPVLDVVVATRVIALPDVARERHVRTATAPGGSREVELRKCCGRHHVTAPVAAGSPPRSIATVRARPRPSTTRR